MVVAMSSLIVSHSKDGTESAIPAANIVWFVRDRKGVVKLHLTNGSVSVMTDLSLSDWEALKVSIAEYWNERAIERSC